MPKNYEPNDEDYLDSIIITDPHKHDVLCGRGGFTNSHNGNEWFRRLVRSNRALYRSCPKHTKLLVAKAIVQAVQQQDPPGRFLEAADRGAGTWRQITYKRAVDKTSQALREKESPADTKAMMAVTANSSALRNQNNATIEAAEQIRKDGGSTSQTLKALTDATLKSAGLIGSSNNVCGDDIANGSGSNKMNSQDNSRKRKATGPSTFVKPSWWSRGTPLAEMSVPLPSNAKMVTPKADAVPIVLSANMDMTQSSTINSSMDNKRMKMADDDPLPLPPAGLEVRQTSLFRFLNTSGIFGGANRQQQQQIAMQYQQQAIHQGTGRRGSSFMGQPGMFSFSRNQLQNPTEMLTIGNGSISSNMQYGGIDAMSSNNPMGRMEVRQQHLGGGGDGDIFEPLPLGKVSGGVNVGGASNYSSVMKVPFNRPESRREMLARNNDKSPVRNRESTHKMEADSLEDVSTSGLLPSGVDVDAAAPLSKGLTTQVSDWLISFFPTGKEPESAPPSAAADDDPAPPPPGFGETLARSISSTIFGLVESPSQLLTSLRSGVTSIFGDPISGSPQLMPGQNSFGAAQVQLNNAGNMMPVGIHGQRGIGVGNVGGAPALGESSNQRSSLLDDYEETPLETKLRNVTSL